MDNANIKMCWVDIETTGLSAQENIPLEVGLKLTDEVGFVVAEFKTLISESESDWMIAMMRGTKDKFVGPMHQKSGLWDDLLDARESGNTLTRKQADDLMCDFLTEHDVRFGTLPLAGSSIGSLDRPFILEHFPAFNVALNYRNIDISSFKEVCKLVNPGLWENLRPLMGSKEDALHRVLEDIDASINEYRLYLENFLFTDRI